MAPFFVWENSETSESSFSNLLRAIIPTHQVLRKADP